MKGGYVFIDRDGVINRDGHGRTEHGYITRWEDFEFLPGVLDGLKRFKESGYKSVIISNQQCVGKGIMAEKDLKGLTERMILAVEKAGGAIDGVFYCTHTAEDRCGCRKPGTGLFARAREEMGFTDLEGGYFLGDSERDIVAGKKAGLRTVLVLSGKSGREEAAGWSERPDIVCEDFMEAVRTVMGEK